MPARQGARSRGTPWGFSRAAITGQRAPGSVDSTVYTLTRSGRRPACGHPRAYWLYVCLCVLTFPSSKEPVTPGQSPPVYLTAPPSPNTVPA